MDIWLGQVVVVSAILVQTSKGLKRVKFCSSWEWHVVTVTSSTSTSFNGHYTMTK
jgi:hypothetical protein